MAKYNRPKISIIGAGSVGTEVAHWCAIKELGDIVIWNRTKEKALGRALDLMEAGPVAGFDVNVKGTGDFRDTKNSDIIVFTAGLPRKSGMTREELISTNAEIVSKAIKQLVKYSPNAFFIMVTNPLDAMTYLAYKVGKIKKNKIMGMAGILDSSRFRSFLANKLSVSYRDISAPVIGSHGENMVPLSRLANVNGIPISQLMKKKDITEAIDHTRRAGAEIIKLLGANASFSTGASAAKMVEAITHDRKSELNCSVYLTGQYGLRDIFIGVPIILGKNGVEKIIELELTAPERAEFHAAAKRIKAMNKVAIEKK